MQVKLVLRNMFCILEETLIANIVRNGEGKISRALTGHGRIRASGTDAIGNGRRRNEFTLRCRHSGAHPLSGLCKCTRRLRNIDRAAYLVEHTAFSVCQWSCGTRSTVREAQ